MAHFVELDENNEVLRVVVVNDDYLKDENGNEVEQLGIKHMQSVYGSDTKWIQTSYNDRIRGRFGRVGYIYNPIKDIFIESKPVEFPSWILDDQSNTWIPPVPMPDNPPEGHYYVWDEASLSWLLVSHLP